MSKAQINSTDWLIRGISEEQLKREKQEALIAYDLEECHTEFVKQDDTCIDYDEMARKMFDKGYCKRSDVLLEFANRLKDAPFKCKLPLLGLSSRDEVEEYFDGILIQFRDAIDNILKEMQ